MFNKLNRTKVFRDPLYGYIEVDYEVISDLIDSKELQRLRRIRQLSGVSMVFHTAEHSRFTHSLGAYQMANIVLKDVTGSEKLSEYEQLLFLVSALLHDIGHGPYSHAFEQVLTVSHEEMTSRIILNPYTDVHKILAKHSVLPEDVAKIIDHKSNYKRIEKLVSSELDVDRMDYLSRDAYFTGATYGTIDRNRLLRSMIITDDDVVVKASGVHSVESYLMSRYHMYFQVYYHPVSRSYELLLENIYKRIKDMYDNNMYIDAEIEDFLAVLKDEYNIDSYLNLDDAYVNGFIKQLTKSNDKVLNFLANSFMNRNLYHYFEVDEYHPSVEVEKNLPYFYNETTASGSAYLGKNGSDIKMLLDDGRIMKLIDYSKVISSLKDSSYKTVKRIYYFNKDEIEA